MTSPRQEPSFLAAARENPVQLAAGATALGFALGMILPLSSREASILGSAVERAREQARDKGMEVVERSKQVAQEAAVGRVVDQVAQAAQRAIAET